MSENHIEALEKEYDKLEAELNDLQKKYNNIFKRPIYVAVLRDTDLNHDIILGLNTSQENLLIIIKDYFGISETKKYDNPAQYHKFVKYVYSEFEDETIGYHIFNEDNLVHKVYIIEKYLNGD